MIMGLFKVLIIVLLSNSIWSLRAPRTGRHSLVGYWGQNGAGPSNGPANYEKPLKVVCETTKYDILAVSFLITFWDARNKDQLPGLNFAFHCETGVSPQCPFLLRCPKIEEGIKECQRRGKKVIMSIGGATGDGTLPSPAKAKEFAHTLYDLFLGGSRYENIRPFGSAVMDGIDLDIEGGRGDNYPDFIRELRMLMDNDPNKNYLITGAPQCPYPDHYLGPEISGSGLEEAGQVVDHLYIQFYNNYCHTGDKWFDGTLDKWLSFSKRKNGPLIFIGVPAHTGASSGAQFYRTPSELSTIYGKLKGRAGIGGIMLWDVSWDQNNIVSGKRYSEHAFEVLKGTSIVDPTGAPTTAAPTTRGPTQEPQTKPTTKPQGPFSCSGKVDGTYPNPSDCAKYHQCYGSVQYDFSCSAGLLFNKDSKVCDWPANVTC